MSRLSILPVAAPPAPVRRVRHELRDGLAVMAFSAAASTAVAAGLVLLTHLATGSGN